MGVSDALEWNGYQKNSTLGRIQLRKLFPSILFLLTPIPKKISAVCNTSLVRRAKNHTSFKTSFDAFLKQYGATHILAEKQIEAILGDINSTIGTQLTKKPVSAFLRVIKLLAARGSFFNSVL